MSSPDAIATLLQAVPDPAFLKTPEHRWVLVNTPFCELLGLAPEDILGKTDSDLFPPTLAVEFSWTDDQVISSQTPIHTPWRLNRSELLHPQACARKGRLEGRTHKNVLHHDGKPYILGIVRDVTESAAAHESLRDELDTAREAASKKDAFLASLSHEIRNPLQAMLEAARQLGEYDLPGTAAKLANLLHRSGLDLLELVDDILDLSHLESGRVDMRKVPFDLPTLLHDAGALYEPMAKSRGGSLSVIVPEGPVRLHGDPVRLRQILSNLLGNAIRYAGHTPIRLELSVGGKASSRVVPITIRISDEGPGFTADEGKLLFERWRRGGTNQKGTGLGLAIVQQTVSAMGGTITAEGRPGAGACFTLHLKLPRAGHQLDIFQNWSATASETEDLRIVPELALAHANVPAPPSSTPAPHDAQTPLELPVQQTGLRALIVEDNHTNQFVLRQQLLKLHCIPFLASDGQEALERLSTETFDIVLMDCQMPVMDGFEATRRWRQMEIDGGRARTPIIAVTALNQQNTREECLTCGMDDVLHKPLGISALQIALKQWTLSDID